MSINKHFNRICAVALILAILVTVLFMNGQALGIRQTSHVIGYEDLLFDTSRVHTIDLVVDDWDGFLTNCENEEYDVCTAVVDNESFSNVAIRAKGNTSLSSVKNMDSSRYSFKLEFDHFDDAITYHGLDKLCLNNIIQDNTYMKDYLTCRMMNIFGVAAPLCSYVWITVNGDPWGLYLAVEAVEDSFLKRNYGSDIGELYKPDSMSMGGGRGNGREFSLSDFLEKMTSNDSEEEEQEENSQETGKSADAGDADTGSSEKMQKPGKRGVDSADGKDSAGNSMKPGRDDAGEADGTETGKSFGKPGQQEGRGDRPNRSGSKDGKGDLGGKGGPGGFGGPGGMGSNDVKLIYTDDDEDSYSNIFGSAKTVVNHADRERLIASIKQMNEQTDLEEVVDVEEVIRYFVVHNFVVNGDSYTGNMVHNYYLHEGDGIMQMIPWDYNLAFGTFQGGDATGSVNTPIDTPVSSSMRGMGGSATNVDDQSDRPMWAWIAENETYLARYHELFAGFLETVDSEAIIDETYALIAPYVAEDPTAFCTAEEFEEAVPVLKEWCSLRTQSVRGQLEGAIPATTSGQTADESSLIDASHIVTSDMGSMGDGMGGGPGGGFPGGFGRNNGDASEDRADERPDGEMPDFEGMTPPDGRMPDMSGFPGGQSPGMAGMTSANYGTDTWILLGVSALVLLAGIGVAVVFRRRR
ncbi:MAG: CotH kinase family protein [Lachnospiraceae bacterium]|nr:CotH kinase family protein [Lachnospiraceae bacterium]